MIKVLNIIIKITQGLLCYIITSKVIGLCVGITLRSKTKHLVTTHRRRFAVHSKLLTCGIIFKLLAIQMPYAKIIK